MLPPGALENADNPDLAIGQKIITTSCSFILNKLNFVGRGVQRTQNFQDLAHGLMPLPPSCTWFYIFSWSAGGEAPRSSKNLHLTVPKTGSKIDQKKTKKHVDGYAFFMCIAVQSHMKIPKGSKF